VVLIGVRCPLPIVRERELLRTDRLNGPHELDLVEFDEVHHHAYEFEVDTSVEPTITSVARIVDHLAARSPRTSSPGFPAPR
jgi:chloramphenicol 3-O-phosphotransferase